MASGKPLNAQQLAYIVFFKDKKTVGQIAQELDISRKSVSNHIRDFEERYK